MNDTMVTQPLPAPDIDANEARERADSIMARSEFSSSESILERLSRWLDELFTGLFDALAGGGAGTVVGIVILGGLVVGLVWVIAQWQPGGRRTRSTLTLDVTVDRAGESELWGAPEWQAESVRLAGLGRFDDAIRARYRALLAELFAAGLLDDVAGRTAGEYRRELAAAVPGVASTFDDLTGQFELVWYGPGDATAADLERFGVEATRLVAGLPA